MPDRCPSAALGRQPATGVTNWIAATPPGRLHVSILTLGEIEQGISRIRDRGGKAQLLPASSEIYEEFRSW